MDKSDQLKKLKDEVDQYQKEYKKKREGYETRVGIINHMLSCMPTLTTLLIGLSCIPGFWETSFKVAGLFASASVIILSHVAKNSSYGAKLLQREITYFALCNLGREISLAAHPEEDYDKYADKFQKIMENDNEMSLTNAVKVVNLFNKYYKEGLEQRLSKKE